MPISPQALTAEGPASQISCDVLVVGAFSDDGGIELTTSAQTADAALNGEIAGWVADGFKAKVGEVALLPSGGRLPAAAIAVVGLGERSSAVPHTIRRAAAKAARRLGDRADVASTLHSAIEEVDAATIASVEGFLLGTYRYDGLKTDPQPARLQRLIIVDGDIEAVEHGSTTAHAVALARDLTNEPASSLTPKAMARRAKETADVTGLQCRVSDAKDLEVRGFGGIVGVGKGGDEPPCLIELRYRPPGATEKVALVGKGVTYDTGGYSIKPAASMETMKTDMAGGAIVLAVMSVLGRLGVTKEVVAYIPCAENMISGSAIRPGDVIKQYGGRSVEVTNTDAEGRLLLADALVLASEEKPHAIIDVATLTGHVTIALGGRVTGFFSTDDELAHEIESAADRSGEGFWRLPLVDSYLEGLSSPVADLKNSGPRPGGAIAAALFLKEFVGKNIPWAHLDIAGTGRSDSRYDEVSKGGTGIPVRTLIEWISKRP
ncbi:MAG: leucyl aminopeptidase [Actinomycetota bacterium]